METFQNLEYFTNSFFLIKKIFQKWVRSVVVYSLNLRVFYYESIDEWNTSMEVAKFHEIRKNSYVLVICSCEKSQEYKSVEWNWNKIQLINEVALEILIFFLSIIYIYLINESLSGRWILQSPNHSVRSNNDPILPCT